MDRLARFQWLNIATKGIASGKERSAVYDELYDHIEDHMDALLAAGFSRELAEEQAISAMGDPYDVSRQLRKVHQPILTWILRVCKGALACALTLWLLYAWVNQPFEQRLLDICYERPYIGSIGLSQEDLLDPVPPAEQSTFYRRSKDTFRQVQMGDCLFTVSRYSVNRVGWYIGSSRHPWLVCLQLEITPEHFWQRPRVPGNFTMVNDQGVVATPQMNDGTELIDTHQYRDGRTCVHAVIADFPTDSRWVDLTYTDAENTFTLRIDLEGGTVYEAIPS